MSVMLEKSISYTSEYRITEELGLVSIKKCSYFSIYSSFYLISPESCHTNS
jgi:hypothetical protein